MKFLSIAALSIGLCGLVFAQEAAAPKTKGSISGLVRDAAGNPVRGVRVRTSHADSTTDAQGRFKLADLDAGTYRVSAMRMQPLNFVAPKTVRLASGEDYAGMDLVLPARASIAGRVVDPNKEPVPGAWVYLIGAAHSLGELRHVFTKQVITNDQGAYLIEGVVPHTGYLLRATDGKRQLDAVSDAPVEARLRKQVLASTFYGGSTDISGASAITVSEGEKLEAMDIQMKKGPSLCVSGKLTAHGQAKALTFNFEDTSASSGTFGDSGFFGPPPSGKTGDDGKIRLCGLTPGQYELSVTDLPTGQTAAPASFGKQAISVGHRDILDLQIDAGPGTPVQGHIVWDGNPPENTLAQNVSVWVQPLTRAPWMGETADLNQEVKVPGDFFLGGVLADSYKVHVLGLKGDLYVKDVRFADLSILRTAMQVGRSMGSPELRVIVGRDGGHIQAAVKDTDGNPVPDCHIVIIPKAVGSGAMLSDVVVDEPADQNGLSVSAAMVPGTYLVLATQAAPDPTPDTVEKVDRARKKAVEVEVKANATASVALGLVRLE